MPAVVVQQKQGQTAGGRVKLRKYSSPTIVARPKPEWYAHSCDNLLPQQQAQQQLRPPLTSATSVLTTLSDRAAVHPLLLVENTTPPSSHTSSSSSSTTTLVAGRRYQNQTYLLPCDDEEIDRLHLLHFMVRFAIQGNYLAPVSDTLRKGGQVLDVGCGPGSWTMEIAGEYPKSKVVGVDVSPMFPRDIKPVNCTFHQCDVFDGSLDQFPDESFDYIFMRFFGMAIAADQWDTLLVRLLRLLKPGGYIELVEADTEMHRPGPKTREYNLRLIQAMEGRHLDPYSGRTLKDRLTNLGLKNVTTTFISCPGGQWAGKLGLLTLQSWQAYHRALAPQICALASEKQEDMNLDMYFEGLQTCWQEANEYKTFENLHFAYAQKSP
ncbi:S-adenosyl-L-methionine-dependent methyltransferase [Syncephalastrum racemosum]|uniref:S-adenosyl-L-methionine-dependent methyltransferase n=1 Tax=Syncephalastrum racemosum TaxID=13706 RepID=A0A1X2HD06_SYNRA|nr:S-adenosyl-L-methionine-dependent methyltransferase [Syncephalastrum racemosum]